MANAAAEVRAGFAQAELPLKIVSTAKEFSTRLFDDTQSFLVDIRKSKGGKNERREYFILYLGAGNTVRVLSTDSKLKQALVLVQEARRTIRVEESYFDGAEGKRKTRTRTQETDASVRRLLVGMDELHLFIAQLREPADTVAQAHEVLKPIALRNASRSSYKRQGEWFFVPCTTREIELIESAIAAAASASPAVASPEQRNAPLGRVRRSLGRPHVAERSCVVNGVEYAKGGISHPDHKTRTMNEWHRVMLNAEDLTTRLKGTQWID